MLIFLCFISLGLSCVHDICTELRRRSLGPRQPFQLPYAKQDYDPSVERLLDRLRQSPWLMKLRIEDGWLWVDQHHCPNHRELLRAFGCLPD